MGERRVSIKEVASAAGVSASTVSLVLNGKGRVSEATRKNVKATAAKLGFIVDRSAARLRSGHSSLVGLIVNDTSNPFFAELSAAFEVEAFSSGYLTIIANSNDDLERQRQLLEAMVGMGVEGLIICPAVGTVPEDLEVLRARNVPYLICVRDISDESTDFIGGDDYQCGLIATRHLLELGHERIAFIGGRPELSIFQRRYKGYLDAHEAAGIAPDAQLLRTGLPSRDFGATEAEGLLSLRPDVTAVLCYNDNIATGVCSAGRAMGRNIGENLSVVGIDNLPESEVTVPPLTTVEMYPRAVGRMAAETMKRLFAQGPDSNVKQVLLSPVLIERASTSVPS